MLDGSAVTFKLGGHDEADFLAADLVVVNPAVDRKKSPLIQAVLAKGIPTTTEMNLFLGIAAAESPSASPDQLENQPQRH